MSCLPEIDASGVADHLTWLSKALAAAVKARPTAAPSSAAATLPWPAAANMPNTELSLNPVFGAVTK